MKIKNILKFCLLSSMLVMLVFTACKKDEVGLPPTADLETLIAEAENLVATSVEGTSPGDYKPGAIQELQDVLTWVDYAVANATSQNDLDKAAIRLQKYIDKFKENTVQLAIPIWNNTPGSWIEISENIKPLLADNFTIEIEAYYLGPGWIETIFSAGEGDNGGTPFGFNLRSVGNSLDLVVGAGPDGWVVGSVTDGSGLKLGEWVHYAFSKSGANWKVYMNGVEIINIPDGPTSTFFDAGVPFVLGETPFWPGRAYNGMLKDFRVWSTVRTADELIANADAQLEGTEDGLEVYFPLDADLGTDFTDNTGNFTAKIVGPDVVWAPDGIPPVIELDYTALDVGISNIDALKSTVVEGENDGDYPMGTIAYLDNLKAAAMEVKQTAEKQDPIDAMVEQIATKLELVQINLVADATGIYVDRENPNAVGLRITPNYTPQGDYTVEFDVKIKTLHMPTGNPSGEIFGNGNFGLRVFGYTEISEEAIRNSGGLWNFTNANNAYEGPTTDPLALTSMVWQHVAIVHDQTAMTTTIYVDGVELAVQEELGFPLESGWGEIWLGNSWGDKMNGTIKDFRLWNSVRSAEELNAEISGNESDLHIYFPLDKVAGLSFADETGNYNAELRGVVWEK